MNKYIYKNVKNFEKSYSVQLDKILSKKADEIGKELSENIETKLNEALKTNIVASYEPRGDGGYVHTNTLIDNIYTETTKIEPGKYKVEAKVTDGIYDDGGKGRVSISDVYDFLRFGTKGSLKHKVTSLGKEYDYSFEDVYGSFHTAINYPTLPHPFEEHTLEQMDGYINSLIDDYKRRK